MKITAPKLPATIIIFALIAVPRVRAQSAPWPSPMQAERFVSLDVLKPITMGSDFAEYSAFSTVLALAGRFPIYGSFSGVAHVPFAYAHASYDRLLLRSGRVIPERSVSSLDFGNPYLGVEWRREALWLGLGARFPVEDAGVARAMGSQTDLLHWESFTSDQVPMYARIGYEHALISKLGFRVRGAAVYHRNIRKRRRRSGVDFLSSFHITGELFYDWQRLRAALGASAYRVTDWNSETRDGSALWQGRISVRGRWGKWQPGALFLFSSSWGIAPNYTLGLNVTYLF